MEGGTITGGMTGTHRGIDTMTDAMTEMEDGRGAIDGTRTAVNRNGEGRLL